MDGTHEEYCNKRSQHMSQQFLAVNSKAARENSNKSKEFSG
jgi:hypothetical protein